VQGVAEILRAFGAERMRSIVLSLLPLGSHVKPSPREGLLWLFAFLPSVIGEDFALLIDEALPIVIKGLSDDVELVRDVAMRSGQAIVVQHAVTHCAVLVPPLRAGSCRHSSRREPVSL
jgi:hypothetical protein